MSTKDKDYLYVGFYISTDHEFVLKIGTTNNLERRKGEHNNDYKKSPAHALPKNGTFHYLWYTPMTKYNTQRYEDSNKEEWKAANFGQYVPNDRFIFDKIPEQVTVKVRKTYTIPLDKRRINDIICLQSVQEIM